MKRLALVSVPAGVFAAACFVLASGCGGSSTTPAAKATASPSPTPANISGQYTGTVTDSVSGAGTIGFSGNTTTISGSYAVPGATAISGGEADFDDTASTTTLTLTGGTLAGSGAHRSAVRAESRRGW